jgi:uncharacterized membrane protein
MIIIILLLSISGFFVSWHIWNSKKKKDHLTCIIGETNSCDIVVKSKYNSFLGIPNEINGMLYYGLVTIASILLFTSLPVIEFIPLGYILLIAGAGSAVFSLYLIVVQSYVLKQWCEWCLVSAGLSIAILIVEIFAFL